MKIVNLMGLLLFPVVEAWADYNDLQHALLFGSSMQEWTTILVNIIVTCYFFFFIAGVIFTLKVVRKRTSKDVNFSGSIWALCFGFLFTNILGFVSILAITASWTLTLEIFTVLLSDWYNLSLFLLLSLFVVICPNQITNFFSREKSITPTI